MLGLADFDEILLPIEAIYDKFAESILSDIARRLLKAGKITSTAAWQSQRVIESGKVFGSPPSRRRGLKLSIVNQLDPRPKSRLLRGGVD